MVPNSKAIDSTEMKHHCQRTIKTIFSPAAGCALRRMLFLTVLAYCAISSVYAAGQTGELSGQSSGDDQLILGKATVCELVKKGIPYQSAIAFSISVGRIYCFTDFLSVGEKTVIYHSWYQQDRKRATVKLALRPPRWATFSSVELRDTDKGPWQVEVTTEKGEILRILRFSIID